MKVNIIYKDLEGFVEYDEEEQRVDVDFPDVRAARKIEDYLNTKRAFKIPESDRIDDFRIDHAFPYEERTYFEIAMCELFSELGVWVDW